VQRVLSGEISSELVVALQKSSFLQKLLSSSASSFLSQKTGIDINGLLQQLSPKKAEAGAKPVLNENIVDGLFKQLAAPAAKEGATKPGLNNVVSAVLQKANKPGGLDLSGILNTLTNKNKNNNRNNNDKSAQLGDLGNILGNIFGGGSDEEN
jgi:hypothetical protein